MEVPNNFYVYVYCKPDGTPFYVGKGKEDRWEHHIKQAKKERTTDSNKLKINTIRKILKQGKEPLIKFIDTNLNEDQAFELEEFMIGWIGRIDLGTGTLTNMTNGGEGCKGQIVSEDRKEQLRIQMSGSGNPNYGNTDDKCVWWGRKHTDETKRKISETQKGRLISEEHKQKMRKPKSEKGRANIAKARTESNYRPSEETKRKLSEALKGRPSHMKGKTWTEEQKLKLSEQRKGLPKPKKLCPYCNREVAVHTYNRWHGDNCKEKNKDAS